MSLLGTVFVREFDVGVLTTLGGSLCSYDVDGDTRQAYGVSVVGFTSDYSELGGKVPIYFSMPEDPYRKFKLPCFVVKRRDINPAFDRRNWYGIAARRPTPGARRLVVNGVTGYESYTEQYVAHPFNIGYDVQIMSRAKEGSTNVGLKMLKHALKICKPPFFPVAVIDSLGETRYYDAGPVDISDTSELADIADRMTAWTISFDVQGELDLWEDEDIVSFHHIANFTYDVL